MFFRLSAHSPRESGARRMCCSSWQILHLVSVSVEPGPEINLSAWEKAASEMAASAAVSRSLSVNHHSHAMPAVPEVAERVPVRHRGLRVAAVVPGAREEADVARAGRRVLVLEAAPRVGMQRVGPGEIRAPPGPALVARDLDALDRALADPGVAAQRDLVSHPEARVRRREGDHRLDRP